MITIKNARYTEHEFAVLRKALKALFLELVDNDPYESRHIIYDLSKVINWIDER